MYNVSIIEQTNPYNSFIEKKIPIFAYLNPPLSLNIHPSSHGSCLISSAYLYSLGFHSRYILDNIYSIHSQYISSYHQKHITHYIIWRTERKQTKRKR